VGGREGKRGGGRLLMLCTVFSQASSSVHKEILLYHAGNFFQRICKVFLIKSASQKSSDMVCAATSFAYICKNNVEGWLQCNTYDALGFQHMTKPNVNCAANQKGVRGVRKMTLMKKVLSACYSAGLQCDDTLLQYRGQRQFG
jgi:hypothetical protein